MSKKNKKQKKITLGLALIVKDEGPRVGGCLDSVKDLDELKVLDTGSTDDTEQVVKEHGGTLVKGYQWKGDYADARNESIKICSTDWVLVLGAGERVRPGGIEEIRRGLEIIESIGDPDLEHLAGASPPEALR